MLKIGEENGFNRYFCIGFSPENIDKVSIKFNRYLTSVLKFNEWMIKFNVPDKVISMIRDEVPAKNGTITIYTPGYQVNKVDPYLE